jgi:hypothetical protein
LNCTTYRPCSSPTGCTLRVTATSIVYSANYWITERSGALQRPNSACAGEPDSSESRIVIVGRCCTTSGRRSRTLQRSPSASPDRQPGKLYSRHLTAASLSDACSIVLSRHKRRCLASLASPPQSLALPSPVAWWQSHRPKHHRLSRSADSLRAHCPNHLLLDLPLFTSSPPRRL